MDAAAAQARLRTPTLIAVGLVVATAYIAALLLLMGSTEYDVWGGLVIAPVLLLFALPAFRRQAAREGNPGVFWFLTLALVLKLVSSLILIFVIFDVYEGTADALGYHRRGARIAEAIRHGESFGDEIRNFTGTNFIRFLTGILYSITGPTFVGGSLFFSWLGFWGVYFFYRAFIVAVPEGRSRTYGRLVFLMPSMLFWPSVIGKEAWMIFGLGITAYGAALLFMRSWAGLGVVALGLWLTAIVRPHMAGLVAVALVFGALLRRSKGNLGQLAPVAKGLLIFLLAGMAWVAVTGAERFLEVDDLTSPEGLATALESTAQQSDRGRSRFVPSLVTSPERAPIATATVLFRPFLFEAHNGQAVIAAMETTFLFLYSLARLPWLLSAVRNLRRRPYLLFAMAYVGLFIVAFSSVANFGILARQRVQLLPFYLALFALPPLRNREEERSKSPASTVGRER